MAVDLERIWWAARAIRARFLLGLGRGLLGLAAGGVSAALARLLGPELGCWLSLGAGLLLYLAPGLAAERLAAGLLSRRQAYTVGVLPFLAGWGVGLIVFSQL